MTIRTPAALRAQMPIGVTDNISAQKVRDIVDTLEARTFVSVKEFGAAGDGVTDDTAAIQAALNLPGWSTVFFPSGTYRTTATLTVANPTAKRLVGAGGLNTIIRRSGNGDIMTFQDANWCSIEELTFQHAAGATSGNGVVFWGINGGANIDRCFFSLNPGHGLAFSGTEEGAQSGNRVSRCLFTENGLQQLQMDWSNDCVVRECAFGGGFGPYAPAGCLLRNSSAGQYTGNEHWNNVYALVIDGSDLLRVVGNRFEESRNEGVLATGSDFVNFTGNFLHTNGQSSSGTYAAMQLIGCTNWNIVANQFMSWNEIRHRNSVLADAASGLINIVGNMMNHNTLAAIDTGAAANVTRTGNSPASVNA